MADAPDPEAIRRAAGKALTEQRGKPLTGIPEPVGRYLAMRSYLIARAVHGRDAPGKPADGRTYGTGDPPPERKAKRKRSD